MARQFSRPGNYRVVVSHERHLCCCLRSSPLLSSYLSIFCFRPIFPFSSFQPFLFIGGFDSSALCRSRRELSNEYLLAKIGVDTAENEPLEVWGKIFNIIHWCPYSAGGGPPEEQARLPLLSEREQGAGR